MGHGNARQDKGLIHRFMSNKTQAVLPLTVHRCSTLLPFELVQAVLWQMQDRDVWQLRRVCKPWQHYIETVIARDWLTDTWVIYEDGRYENPKARPMFRICNMRPRPASAWPLVRKDNRWLVYALPRKPVLPEYIPPPRYRSGRFMYTARVEQERDSVRAKNPAWANMIVDGKINVVPPRCAVPNKRSVKLYASHSKKVLDGRIVGYDLGVTDTSGFLKINWRVLLSVMFTPVQAGAKVGAGWKRLLYHGPSR